MKVFLSLVAIPILAVSMSIPEAVAVEAAGTTLVDANKTATGYFDRVIKYDWSVTKSADPTSVTINPGETKQITYKIDVTRNQTGQEDVQGVRGAISVKNGGAVATTDLAITDLVKGSSPGACGLLNSSVIISSPVSVSGNPVLDAGETGSYNYDIQFAGTAGASYRNDADITITNHAGHMGEPFGPQACTAFSIPSDPTVTYEDATAMLTDTINCPSGFTCTPLTDNGPWDLTDNATKTVTVDVTNSSDVCNQQLQLINIAKVVEGTTKEERTNDAHVAINTDACVPQVTGCTFTQGYWKTHPEAWPVNSLTMGGYSYTKTELLSILNTPVKGNGLIALAYQQIAALLNTENGASAPQQIGTAITSANNLMATTGKVPPVGQGYLPTSQTSYLTGVLDSYNQGLATGGPLHCE